MSAINPAIKHEENMPLKKYVCWSRLLQNIA